MIPFKFITILDNLFSANNTAEDITLIQQNTPIHADNFEKLNETEVPLIGLWLDTLSSAEVSITDNELFHTIEVVKKLIVFHSATTRISI